MKYNFPDQKVLSFFGFLFFSLFTPIGVQAADDIHLGITDKQLYSFFDVSGEYHQILKTNVMLSSKIKSPNAAKIEKTLSLDLAAISREALLDEFESKSEKDGFAIAAGSDGDSLFITPWVLLQFLEDGRVMAWTCWNVQYWDLYWNKKKWEGACFAGLSDPRPLEGDQGWISDSGEYLKQAVINDTRALVECAMKDLNGSFKSYKFQKSKLRGVWFSEKKATEMNATYLKPDTENLLIYKYDDRVLQNFLAAGLTGVLLKTALPNSILFNGSLLLPSKSVEIVPGN
jgi:hypothetical protein